MTVSRVKLSNIVQSQLPNYVRDSFPLISEFLKSYYQGQEFQGAPIDLITNIDKYIKINEQTGLTEEAVLNADITPYDKTITVEAFPNGTNGFPDSYGLLKIDNEIITYTGKTATSFTGCVRGFCGITTYRTDGNNGELSFNTTDAASHEGNLYDSTTGEITREGSKIQNLTILFLKEFLKKTKNQLLPGFENRPLSSDLNQNLFIKQAKDFYSSKGTDRSFEILFGALYNERVEIVRPKDFLFTPSNANFRITNDLVVTAYEGDPLDLEQATLFQDPYRDLTRAYAPVTNIEKIEVGVGETYYKMSMDAGYNRDLRVDGAMYGVFSVHATTKVIGDVAIGQSFINVDSTVGFAHSGNIDVYYNDATLGIVSYTSKTINEFHGVSNVVGIISDTSNVGIDTYAYGLSMKDQSETVKVKITSVLKNLVYPNNTYYYSRNDTARIKSLGTKDNSFKSRDWFYNTSPIYNVAEIQLLDASDFTYKITLTKLHYFRIGDAAQIAGADGVKKSTTIIDISSPTALTIRGQGFLSLSDTYTIKRNILKVLTNNFEGSQIYSTNVQNTYKDGNKLLVASSSIPSYNSEALNTTDREVTFSGTFVGTEFQITSTTDHGFRTGDAVYFTPQKEVQEYTDFRTKKSAFRTVVLSQLIPEGLYFIERVQGSTTTVRLATSRANLFNDRFVSVDTETIVTNNKIKPYEFRDKKLQSQQILREIAPPTNDGIITKTEPGATGILVNGVEILNYKSNDLVRYGQIENIEVVSSGSDYDIINPPTLNISDAVGTGATGYAGVTGELKEIRILNEGFDYEETPLIKISGGSGANATAVASMKLKTHAPFFNAEAAAARVGLTTNIIGFGTYHKFRNVEKVIYLTGGQEGIGGITTSAAYYVRKIDDETVSLHKDEAGAVAGINTVDLTSHGMGQHQLESFNKKLVLESINITNPGSGYQNKKLTVNPTGINTASNTINIVNHRYANGEIVTYESSSTEIGGLSSSNQYKVIVVDNNNFKLANAGVGGTNTSDYDKGIYVDFTSIGSGTHSFNYQPITVSLVGKVGISSIGSETFQASVQPIFRGGCTSVHLENKGVGYGSSEIVNLDRQPDVTLIPGAQAQLQPVIDAKGQIVEVLVLNSGKQYLSPPDIIVTGDGVGAVVTPVMENNTVASVKILEGGVGYTAGNTTMTIQFPGSGVQFNTVLQSWRINLVQKYFNLFSDDDGFITLGLNREHELQYTHLYAPRKLREAMYGRDASGKILYGKSDLRRVASVEVESTDHSPIIGYAYDGNPIYGPYGFVEQTGGVVKLMKSSYSIKLQDNRPPIASFPEGIFVNDYEYKEVKDQSYLDENNGRFCVTPEYPNGTYAYFATIDPVSSDTSGNFAQYRRPQFPYLIGDGYTSVPNKFNFKSLSCQKEYEFRNTTWLRNIDPYNLMDDNLKYEYLTIPNDLKQVTDVKAIGPGFVETVGIDTGGQSYRVGDEVVLDNTKTEGTGANIRVSRVLGKEVSYVSVASSTVSGVEIYPAGKGQWELVAATTHGFKDQDLVKISGVSTTSSKIEGVWTAGITTTAYVLTGIGSTTIGLKADSVTGIVTHINVTGDLTKLRENDILGIGTEQVKVLNVEPKFSRIRILRAVNGTGISHTVTSVLDLNPRTLRVNAGFNTTYEYRVNKQLYFNPVNAVAIGTALGVGVGSTVPLANPGAGISEIFNPTRSIYIRDHGLETGDQLTYNTNVGAGLSVMLDTDTGTPISTLDDGTVVFAARISSNLIGISTVKVGLGSTGTFVGIASTEQSSSTMFFTGLGTGLYHSFTTNFDPITAEMKRNLVTVSTASTHGLKGSDTVYVNVNPSNTGIHTVHYNDYNRRFVLDPKDFIASGVNTTTNAITIADHGYVSGDKIIHRATTPSAGLLDNKIYYIVRVDDNTFKLSDTYYNATQLKPPIIGITSASAGTIKSVNPKITVYKNSTVTFDLSDNSLSYVSNGTAYPAFQFNLYKDENFTEKWFKSSDAENFELQRVGVVGITADAKVNLTVNEDIPEVLFYKLDPIYESDLPSLKSQAIVDDEALSASEIQVKESVYNGKYTIGLTSTTTFTYSIAETPELSTYSPSPTIISYETDSALAFGAASKFEIKNPGRNYYSLPGITTITSSTGKGAIISVGSTSIGRVRRTKIENIGYNFPIDTTVRPDVNLGLICEMNPYTSFESIGINSRGRGYTSAPELLVFDGKTREQIEDVELDYKLGDPIVNIRQNTFGMSNLEPIILPVQNTNGVGISSVGWSTNSYDVTLTLAVGFSTANSFPFSIGDKILVEGVSVGVGSTGGGFNSADYDYKLFTVNGLDENYGGIGTIGYRLDNTLLEGRVPGNFNSTLSIGRVIPEKYFPKFNIVLRSNDYLEGETVKTPDGKNVGTVESWDPRVGVLNISTGDDFPQGEKIIGQSSNTQGRAVKVLSFPTTLETGPFSKVENGWETSSGFINDTLQRVQDSFYYQNFSYSLRSRVAFDTWDDVVSSTNHTAGFKKFSDYQLETPADALTSGVTMPVGLTTDTTSFEVVSDLINVADLNCVNDFDLVTENSKATNRGTVSDEIVFNTRILQDFFESVGNRVLSIDDMSGTFNSNPRSTPFSIASQFPLNSRRCMKYITYVRDRRFVAQRQIMVVDLVHDDSFGYINQYGQAGTVYPLGTFDFSIVGTDGRLLFYPTNFKVNDYDVVAVAYNLDDNLLGIGSTSLGCAEIFTSSTAISSGGSETLVSIGYTYRSLKVLASITGSDHNEFEMEEINLIHDGTTVDVMEYGQLTSNLGSYVSASGFGTYVPSISGTNINLDFKAHTGIACTVNTIVVGLSSEAFVGVDTNGLKHVNIESRTTGIASASSPGIHTVAQYLTSSGDDDHFDAAYFMVQVSDTTNNTYQMSEILMVDDYNADLGTSDAYLVEYGNIETVAGLGTFGAQVNTTASAKYSQLMFTPNPNITTQVKVFMNSFQIEDDEKDIIQFANGSIETFNNIYTGTENTIKRSFNLTHRGNEIFNKDFTNNDTNIISTTQNTIRLPNHFFVTGEKVKYIHAGAGTTQAIGIETTDEFVGIGTTDKLPGDVFIFKVNEDTVKLCTTAENALAQVPVTLGISTVGVGTSARFAAINQNAKAIIALDNIIQSPVVATSVTTSLAKRAFTTDDILTFTGITSFVGGDLVRIGDEIMKIEGVGIGSTNTIRVRRPWMGTSLAGYSTGAQVTKVNGNYNIVENILTFVEAPYGNIPLGTSTNPPDERDWTGISTSSSFQGRTFMRSGIQDSTDETYAKNVVLDDISTQFTGDRRNFNLYSNGNNVTGIATNNGVILINDVFQGPGANLNYTMNENLGVTSIRFTGTATSIGNDVNTSNLPVGGVIVSVGSTEGFGYQPLVAAGGTATVSTAGTIRAITLSNAGSGYRYGIGQVVSVGIQTQATRGTNITGFGTAIIGTGGALTGVAITNVDVIYKPRDISNIGYNSITGISTVTTAFDHGLTQGEEIKLSGIAFTCDYAPPLGISTIVYDENVGVMTVTTNVGHGLTTIGTKSSNVIFTGLAFTCALDSGVYQHIYPRNRDRFFNTAIEVTGVGNTFTASNAVFDPTIGIATITTTANHGMATGDKVLVEYESLTFSTDDGDVSLPQPGDLPSSRWLSVLSVPGVKRFSAKILESPPSSNTNTHTFKSATSSGITTQTGLITINVTPADPKFQYPHTFVGVGTTGPVLQGGAYVHNFIGATPGAISVVGTGASFTPTEVLYDGTSGILTATLGDHGLTTSDSIRFTTRGLTFTCEMDQHGTRHPYPRESDPFYERNVSIAATTATTISVNVGTSPFKEYPATAGAGTTYYHTNGDLVIGVGTHDINPGTSIKLRKSSLIFTCTKDGNTTRHYYPREGDPGYAGVPVTGIVSERTFTVNVGISTVLSHFTGVGSPTVQPIIRAPRPTDIAAPGATVLDVLTSKSFLVQTGISTRRHFYARGGRVDKPQDVVIDDPLSYTNIPLQYASGSTGIGSEATIDIVVGQGSSVIDFSVNNTGYAYGQSQTLTIPFGGLSGIPTDSSFSANNQFEVEITKTFTDEFTGWTLGTLQALDDIAPLFDGGRITFPITLNGTAVSIRAGKGSVINVQDVLLIFVNDVLQVPGDGYKFEGGSVIEFTEAPKVGDTCKILFYKGSGDDVDVVFRNVIETVKKGDSLQIYNRDDQGVWFKENPRSVTQVTSTDTVDTTPYYGPGNTNIESMLRPVKWCRQTEDKIINDLPVGKDRELYEPVINPTANIIQSVGVGSTQVYLQSVRPFFNPKNEINTALLTFQDKVKFSRPSGTKVAAAATAVVSTAGTISSFVISEGGIGYGATPNVSVANTAVGVGSTSTAIGTATISGGVVTGIAVSNQGSGYSQSNPPVVLIGPPTTTEEEVSVRNFYGDQGVLVGFGTTSVGVGTTAFMMDLFIPRDSFLRQSLYMVDSLSAGSITTVSGITTGDYFVVDNSNIGIAVTSIVSLDVSGDTVGTGVSFIDNVYQVYSAETVTVNVSGIGFTDVRRVFAAVKDPMHFGSTSGITSSPNYGKYSWGKLDLVSRSISTSYTAQTSNGVVGLTTSASVERSASLRFKNYNV